LSGHLSDRGLRNDEKLRRKIWPPQLPSLEIKPAYVAGPSLEIKPAYVAGWVEKGI